MIQARVITSVSLALSLQGCIVVLNNDPSAERDPVIVTQSNTHPVEMPRDLVQPLDPLPPEDQPPPPPDPNTPPSPKVIVRHIEVPGPSCRFVGPPLPDPPEMPNLSDPSIVTQRDVENLVADHINNLNDFILQQRRRYGDALRDYHDRCGE